MAVGAIDYLLLDVPLLQVSTLIPVAIEERMLANGLNPTTSYWFGKKQKNQNQDGTTDTDKTK